MCIDCWPIQHQGVTASCIKRGGGVISRSMQNCPDTSDTYLLISQVRKWIEEFTRKVSKEKGFLEYIQDGILLCEIIQKVCPGYVKKINRIKNPFAWRENLCFFLEACQRLGLKEFQLFSEEDLRALTQPAHKPNIVDEEEKKRRLRNIAVTIFWFARTVGSQAGYNGPELDLIPTVTKSPVKDPIDGIQKSPKKIFKVEGFEGHTYQQGFAQIVHCVRDDPSPTNSGRPSTCCTYHGSDQPELNCVTVVSADLGEHAIETTSLHREAILTTAVDPHRQHQVVDLVASCVIEPSVPQLISCGKHKLHGNSLSLQVQAQDSDASTSFSGASTVIACKRNTSHCSTSSNSGELGRVSVASIAQSEFSGTESSLGSPPVKRHSSLQDLDASFQNTTAVHEDFSSCTNTNTSTCGPIKSARPTLQPALIDNTLFEHVSAPNSRSSQGSAQETSLTHIQRELSEIRSVQSRVLTASIAKEISCTIGVVVSTSATSEKSSESVVSCLQTAMASRAHTLSIYPSPSRNDNSSGSLTSVPHHSLYTTNSVGGSDSPPLPHDSPRRILYIVPSSSGDCTAGTSTDVSRSNSHHTQAAVNKDDSDLKESVDIILVLLPGEKMLGFSVAGGKDQGAYPRVQSIEGNTPASRSTLCCGDELLSVNSESLRNTVHSTVTEMLHKALSQRRVVLQVRQRTDDAVRPHLHTSSINSDHASENSLGPPIMAINTEEEPVVDVSGVLVQSGSLPRSLHAKMSNVVYNAGESTLEEKDTADFLSDIASTSVEIGSSLGDADKLSFCESQRSASSFQNAATSHPELDSTISPGLDSDLQEDSLVDSVLAVAKRHSDLHPSPVTSLDKAVSYHKPTRPLSAPSSRHPGFTIAVAGISQTLHSGTSQDRKITIDEERQRRRSNIEESARAAINYSVKRKSSKTESLPRQMYSSPSTHHHSLLLEDGHCGKSTFDDFHSCSSSLSAQSSTPLNLHNVSIDETREASLNQMDQIWKEVENESSETSRVDLLASQEASGAALVTSSDAPDSFNALSSSESYRSTNKPGEVKTNPDSLQPSTVMTVCSIHDEENAVIPVQQESPTTLEEAEASTPHSSPAGTSIHCGTKPLISREEVLASQPALMSSKGIESLLVSLRSLNEKVGTYEEEEEFRQLEDMLQSSTFKKAKEFHDGMRSLLAERSKHLHPVQRRAGPHLHATRYHLYHFTEPGDEVAELRAILRDPHIQAVLFCHDKVSTKDLYISGASFHKATREPEETMLSGSVCDLYVDNQPIDMSIPLSRDVPSSRKEEATIIFLTRTNRPLGCTLYQQAESVFVGKLLKGCDADQSGVLREGDELLEVNGIPLMRRSTDEIVRLMSAEPETTLVLTIIPVHDDNVDPEYEPKYIRAHFNYNGHLDEEMPCKPLGLTFQKGDILEISNQDDPDWWQARKVFEDGAESLPGLIPARHLQQTREALVRSYPCAGSLDGRQKKKNLRSLFSKKKKRTIYYQQTPPGGIFSLGDEVVTYEDVVLITPNPERRRPVVLIGAAGAGKRTLMQKLISSEPGHFCPIVQHTTRIIRQGEVHGHDYYFVTRDEFERDMHLDRFLEYEDLKGHLYGTAFSSIKKVMEAGHVPVMDLHPQALKLLRHSGLMPYVVFVAAPKRERLHSIHRIASDKRKRRLSPPQAGVEESRTYTEGDLKHIIEKSRLIDSQYGHYFDWIIVNDDFQVAADMLKEVARRIEEEPQWVPAGWTHDQ